MSLHDLESLVEVRLPVQQRLLRGRRNHPQRLLDVVGLLELEAMVYVSGQRRTYKRYRFVPRVPGGRLVLEQCLVRVLPPVEPHQGRGDLRVRPFQVALAPPRQPTPTHYVQGALGVPYWSEQWSELHPESVEAQGARGLATPNIGYLGHCVPKAVVMGRRRHFTGLPRTARYHLLMCNVTARHSSNHSGCFKLAQMHPRGAL